MLPPSGVRIVICPELRLMSVTRPVTLWLTCFSSAMSGGDSFKLEKPTRSPSPEAVAEVMKS
jgi:hypothetical protein